jgi:hypothetical protein
MGDNLVVKAGQTHREGLKHCKYLIDYFAREIYQSPTPGRAGGLIL